LSPITYFEAVPDSVREAFGWEMGIPNSVVIFFTSPDVSPDVSPKNWTSQNWKTLLICSPPTQEGQTMKKSKFSEEQIATALRQIDAGAPIREVTRALGISEATYYIWRKKYGQMAVAEIRRLRQLEEENRKLKQLVADLTLDKVILQEVLAKKA
jgi:putative transposase